MPVLRSKPKQKAEYTAFMASQRRSKPAPKTDRRLSDSSATSSSSNNLRPVADDMPCGKDISMELEITTTVINTKTLAARTITKKTTMTTIIKAIAEGFEPPPDDDDTIAADTDEDTTPPRPIEIPFDKPERGADFTSQRARPFELSVFPKPPLPTPPTSPLFGSRPTRAQRLAMKRAERNLDVETARKHAELAKKHRQMGIYSWCVWPRNKNGEVNGKARWLDGNVKHKFVDNRGHGCITEAERAEDREMLSAAGIVIEGL